MVKYIFTPWRDRHELLAVRAQFYPSKSSALASLPASEDGAAANLDESSVRKRRHDAVARVSMWVQRGHCPHLVESTALLTAAILDDNSLNPSASSDKGCSTFAVRAAYAAAFSRFVTGLLDSHQDKQRKMSMFSVAKTIGLPATFVELRHQATHEQLPSLGNLQSAANRALLWIWDYYWQHLPDESNRESNIMSDPCRDWLLSVLSGDPNAVQGRILAISRPGEWSDTQILTTLLVIIDVTQDSQVLLRALRCLRGELMHSDTKGQKRVASSGSKGAVKDLESLRAELAQDRQVLEREAPQPMRRQPGDHVDRADAADVSRTGWTRYKGKWKPKPIGVT